MEQQLSELKEDSLKLKYINYQHKDLCLVDVKQNGKSLQYVECKTRWTFTSIC